MNPKQMREFVIAPALLSIEAAVPYSRVAEDLLMATACAESFCGYFIKQDPGPAEGFFQMEPATEHDIWLHFLSYRNRLASLAPKGHSLINNLDYSVFMARMQYYRRSEPLPEYVDDVYDYLELLAKYWKKYYNTMKGKGTIEGFVAKSLKYGDFS